MVQVGAKDSWEPVEEELVGIGVRLDVDSGRALEEEDVRKEDGVAGPLAIEEATAAVME